ncbi:FAD/NAD(P)-binding protein [Thermocatellispora tengchongensis]|uniref:FAD/NAD(P)-binding protein n=1 Tax=Thermocatellispora tengchongensis TaxID=1073253 RepID=UPI0036376C1A
MRNPPTVALVGGGASGTLSAVHLLSYAHARGVPLSVTMIDRYGRHGMGQAYSTTDPHHLLNACAEKMSAIDGDPGHLLRWAAGQGLGADGSAFLPRAAYGRYLCHVLAEAERRAAPGGRVARMTGTVRALARAPGGGWRVRLAGGGGFDADAVVLATGNPAPAARPELAGAAGYRYVPAPWEPGALIGIDDGSPVLVIGTGLTMVDVAISVTRAHPGTVVYAVSRHGLLPRPHPCDAPPPVAVPLPEGPLRLAGLLRAVRAAVVHNGGDWHGVVDGLRPRVPELWARLSGEDRRRFLALVARYWEVHRHRLPPPRPPGWTTCSPRGGCGCCAAG